MEYILKLAFDPIESNPQLEPTKRKLSTFVRNMNINDRNKENKGTSLKTFKKFFIKIKIKKCALFSVTQKRMQRY